MIDDRGPRRVTAGDVSRTAGVSESAVSRTYTPGAYVSAKTRERVLKAAEELGYRPNIIARSLRAQHTNLIGVLITDFGNPWPQMALKRLVASLQKRGLQALLFDVDGEDSLAGLVPLVLQYQVDGLIVGPADIAPAVVETCKAAGTPIVAFGRHGESLLGISSVSSDDEVAGAGVAELLHARGYRQLAYVDGDPSSPLTWTSRCQGFAQRAEVLGLGPVTQISMGESSYKAGLQAASILLGAGRRPDAVFCQNDLLAMGFLDSACLEFGLAIPEDLAVVGFDDIPAAGQLPYQLTTVRQPIAKMMDTAVDLLVRHLSEHVVEGEARLLPSLLVERRTVRPGVNGPTAAA